MYINSIFYLALQNLKIDYRGTLLSFLWIFISFLIFVLAKIFIFKNLFVINKYFDVYVYSGLLTWQMIDLSISKVGNSLYQNSLLINIDISPFTIIKIRFTEMLIIFLINSPFLLILIFLNDLEVNYFFLFFVFFFCFLIVYYFSIFMNIISIYLRDFYFLIKSLLRVLFFITPVFWPVENLPEKYSYLLDYNLAYHFISLPRNVILYSKFDTLNFYILSCFLIVILSFIHFKGRSLILDSPYLVR